MTVRARVWSTPDTGINRKTRRPRRTWHYEVYNSAGQVVLYDNTGYWAPVIESALIEVTALRHMETAGHKLKPYRAKNGETR